MKRIWLNVLTFIVLSGMILRAQAPQTLPPMAADADPSFEVATIRPSDPAATDELIRMAKSDPEGGVRGQAIFWLAQKAGKKAIAAMQDAMENDPDFEVKKKAVFALSQLPKDESVTQLMHVADTNQNPKIRKEAIFWLGQTNDPRALAYLEDILKR